MTVAEAWKIESITLVPPRDERKFRWRVVLRSGDHTAAVYISSRALRSYEKFAALALGVAGVWLSMSETEYAAQVADAFARSDDAARGNT
jgi:hypothetical protein